MNEKITEIILSYIEMLGEQPCTVANAKHLLSTIELLEEFQQLKD